MQTIGIDARFYGTGFTGIGRYAAELLDRVPRLMPDTRFVVFLNEPEYHAFTSPFPLVEKRLVAARHYSVREQTTFLAALRNEQLDLMHFTHFNAPLLYGRKSVVTIHDLTLHLFPGKKMARILHRAAYHAVVRTVARKAERIIAVSQHTAADIVRFLGEKKEKIVTIPNGVSDAFAPALDTAALGSRLRERLGIESPYVLYTGVWRDHKNLVRLVEAFAETDIPLLVITGREDMLYGPVLRARIAALGIEQRVHFAGLVPEEDFVPLMQRARVFAFPSLYEGFGLPPLEAQQCGVPVVSSSAACMPEVLGEGAEYVDPYSTKDIARGLSAAWHDEELRKKLVLAGTKNTARFSWEQCANETASVYAKALG